MKIIKATIKDLTKIYLMWKETKQRILGLKQSLKDNCVFLITNDCGDEIGFLRVSERLTTDYLKINELYIPETVSDLDLANLTELFDELLLNHAYNKARITVSDEKVMQRLIRLGFVSIGKKFGFSQNSSSYILFELERIIEKIKYEDLNKFGGVSK